MTGGVDLSQIDGVNVSTILTMMSETGFSLKSKFPTPKHFASWLGFAPNRKITGGKVISSKTPKVKNHLAYAIRQAANSAGNSKGRLGDFYRRLAYRKGGKVAVIATARKIAVIIYKMLENGQEYSYQYAENEKERLKLTQLKNINKKIKQLNIKENELNFSF